MPTYTFSGKAEHRLKKNYVNIFAHKLKHFRKNRVQIT